MIPNVRLKIPEEKIEEIKENVELKANNRLLQGKLQKQGVWLTLRDLSNIKAKYKIQDGDNLVEAVRFLISKESSKILTL